MTDDDIVEREGTDLLDGEEMELDATIKERAIIPGEKEAFDAISGSVNSTIVQKVTKEAADKLNLGLLLITLDTILEARRTQEKINKLEARIYSPSGIVADKDLVKLYANEKATYAAQIEIVRKYVLNNKSALEELVKPTQDLVASLSQLPAEKIDKLREIVEKMKAEDEIPEGADLLEDE